MNNIRNIIKLPKTKNKINSEYDHSDFGEIEIKEIPRVKKIAAPHLSNSWNTIPHVTHHDEADITELDAFRKTLQSDRAYEGVRITLLGFVIKVLASAMKANQAIT